MARLPENPGMSGYQKQSRQYLWRHTVAYDDIHIRQDHRRRSSTASNNAAFPYSSIPGRTPPDPDLGRTTRLRCGANCDWARTSLKPCSISAVKVCRRSAASRLACSSRPSSSRTVVRICLSRGAGFFAFEQEVHHSFVACVGLIGRINMTGVRYHHQPGT